jgi:hypothetical protein
MAISRETLRRIEFNLGDSFVKAVLTSPLRMWTLSCSERLCGMGTGGWRVTAARACSFDFHIQFETLYVLRVFTILSVSRQYSMEW